MTAAFMLQSLTATPIFASRPFVAAFMIALFARFSNLVPSTPDWLTEPWALTILGILAILDMLANKENDIRVLLDEFDPIIKAVVTFVVTLSFVDTESAAFLGVISDTGPMLSYAWPLLTSGSTFLLASTRRTITRSFIEADQEDDLGVQSIFSWGEDISAILGTMVVVIFPIISVALFIATIIGLFISQRLIERLSEKHKVACIHCNEKIHASAPVCHLCNHYQPSLRQVGIFGQARKQLATDLVSHRYELISRRRCPVCATRFQEKTIQQSCKACGTVTFTTPQDVDGYLRHLQTKLPRTLLICLGISFIPVLGIVPGVIFYHLELIAGLRTYIPRRLGCVTRWLILLLNLILISGQWVPIGGALILPSMCAINYFIYQKMVARERQRLVKDLGSHEALDMQG